MQIIQALTITLNLLNKMGSIHTVEYHSDVKRNEVYIHYLMDELGNHYAK